MNRLSVLIFSLLFLYLCTLHLAAKVPEVLEQYQYCGVAEETSDLRTHAPWIVSIYLRLGKNSKRVKFLTTGLVTSPTIITSFFGGRLDFPLVKDRAQLNQFLRPETFFIVTALNSTNLQNADQFTEFLEVEYVQPYTGIHQSWKRFHLVQFHLKHSLEISPYIRPPCVRFPDRILELAKKEGKFRSLYPENVQSVLYGHSYPSKNGHYDLIVMKVRVLTIVECEEEYKKYYNASLPTSISCAQSIEADTPGSTISCIQPNGVRMDKLFGSKNFITGEIAMVPDRKTNTCTKDTVYFVYIPSRDESNWYAKSIGCSPQFACYKEDKCIDWTNVCDSVNNCEKGEDEDDIYCSRVFKENK